MAPARVAGAIEFPLHNRYLPWSTLEGDFQKHGYEISSWPSGVPHENDKGINTLSTGHVHKLYLGVWIGRSEPGDDIRSQCTRLEEKARERLLRRKGKEDKVQSDDRRALYWQ